MAPIMIILAGLPGVGKTTTAARLGKALANFRIISQLDIQQNLGFKVHHQPGISGPDQDQVLRKVDQLCGAFLTDGYGVVVDSVNRFSFRRSQLYGIASAFGQPAVILEITCSGELAKQRLKIRPQPVDDLIADPSDPTVYDRLHVEWEDVSTDFRHTGQGHVAHVRFDTEFLQFTEMISTSDLSGTLSQLREILLCQHRPDG